MASILITGANGFIGSHTTLLMESLGHKVVPIDVMPRSPDLSLLGIKAPSHIMNVTDAATFRALCEKKADAHLSCRSSSARRIAHGIKLLLPCNDEYSRSSQGIKNSTRDLFQLRFDYGQLKKPDGSLVKEEDAVPIYPTYFYRAAKTVSEWMGDFYKEKHGVDFVALRYSSVYGPVFIEAYR